MGDRVVVFVGTVDNKLDRKGRVSVPAAYRTRLTTEGFPGFFAYPSPRLDSGAIEACGMRFMEILGESIGQLEYLSEEQDELTALLFAKSHQLEWDAEGRVTLPEALIAHAGITDRVAFVGRGKTFQLWQPEKFAVYSTEVESRSRLQPRTVRMIPMAAGGERE